MSSGSTFILTMHEGKKTSKKVYSDLCTENMKSDEVGNKPKDLPAYMYHEKKHTYDYVEKDTRKLFIPIAEWSFTSSFTVLKEFYYLNPYERWNCIREISYEDIRKWRQAAEYIMQGKYSEELERLLANPYIRELKQEGYTYCFNKKGRNEDSEEDFMKRDLIYLHSILFGACSVMTNDLCDSYVDKNKKAYKLLYLAW